MYQEKIHFRISLRYRCKGFPGRPQSASPGACGEVSCMSGKREEGWGHQWSFYEGKVWEGGWKQFWGRQQRGNPGSMGWRWLFIVVCQVNWYNGTFYTCAKKHDCVLKFVKWIKIIVHFILVLKSILCWTEKRGGRSPWLLFLQRGDVAILKCFRMLQFTNSILC